MKKTEMLRDTFIVLLLGFCHVLMASSEKASNEDRKTYIVHMDKSEMRASFNDHTHWYDSSLRSVSDSAEMLYTYNNVVHGFSTRLTEAEAQSLENQPGILSVLPEFKYELHTTRTPEFLGLDKKANLFPEFKAESEVIIGVFDTGVWPESKSFDDTGLGPIPGSWKGQCESGNNFNSSNCNRKLIGARSFSKGYIAATGAPINELKESNSPRDDDGHGTHTATTAAGAVVQNASLFGFAYGTARGIASRARVAVYKVCWLGGCFSSDILKAMDVAIDDNVNVMSLSLGGGMADYYRDSIARGAFAAMEKGIFVSCSAGNGGRSSYTLSNVAPWITTVGAGTLDRDFPAYVSLGNGLNFTGDSLYRGDPLPSKMLPFIYAGNASDVTNGNLCMAGTLIPEKVNGKIVLCDRGVIARLEKGSVVNAAGGVGMILANTEENGEELLADAFLLPATAVTKISGDAIKSYLFSESNPTVTIHFDGTKVGIEPSPMVAAFSSSGPSALTPDILKPDIIAPGVNILAGWAGLVGPSELVEDPRHVEFNIISGTSMACPHVSGLAALLKATHPEWSPAAIRSALMTTAYNEYKDGQKMKDLATGKPSTPFDHGAGHVDPVSALNPGLIYDLTADNYLSFLCGLNYTALEMKLFSRRNFTCDPIKARSVTDLNYPSFGVSFPVSSGANGNGTTVVKYTRTVTNVGSPGTYKVSISSESKMVKISVVPGSLSFSVVNEKKSYTVTFTGYSVPSNTNSFGQIEWSDGKHIVRSPVAVTWT